MESLKLKDCQIELETQIIKLLDYYWTPKERSQIVETAASISKARNDEQQRLINMLKSRQNEFKIIECLKQLESCFGIDFYNLERGESFLKTLEEIINEYLESKSYYFLETIIRFYIQLSGKTIENLPLAKWQETAKTDAAENLKNGDWQSLFELAYFWKTVLGFSIEQLGLEAWTKSEFQSQILNTPKTEMILPKIRWGTKIWMEILQRDVMDLDGNFLKIHFKRAIQCGLVGDNHILYEPNLYEIKEVMEFWHENMELRMGLIYLDADFRSQLINALTNRLVPYKEYAVWICRAVWISTSFLRIPLNEIGVVAREEISPDSLALPTKSSSFFNLTDVEIWLNLHYDPQDGADREKHQHIELSLEQKFIESLQKGSSYYYRILPVWQKFNPEKVSTILGFLQLNSEQQQRIIAKFSIDFRFASMGDLIGQILCERQKTK